MFFIVTVTNRIPVFFRKTKQIQVRRTVTGTKTPGGKRHSNRIHSKKIKQRQSRGNFIRRLSATVMEILFVLRQKCPTCVIHLFPYLPRFDQFFSNVRATNTYIYFHVKNFFPDVLLHDLPSSLYNRNVYREDKLHLTKKENDILTKWFHYCISNASPPANPTLNTSPSDFASNDEDWPALPQPSPKPNPTPPIPCPLSSRNLIQSTKSKPTQTKHSAPPIQVINHSYLFVINKDDNRHTIVLPHCYIVQFFPTSALPTGLNTTHKVTFDLI